MPAASASTSSLPDWTGLAGPGPGSEGPRSVPLGPTGLESSMRLYCTGVNFSKLDSSLLGRGLLVFNVLDWVDDFRNRNGCFMKDEWDGDEAENEGCAGEDGCAGGRGTADDGGWVGDGGFSGDGGSRGGRCSMGWR